MRVLVIANREDPETGFVGTALATGGAAFDQAWRDDDEPLPEVAAHDLVLSLGSDWSVYWPERAPEVERELEYLRDSVESGVPVLGICFGAQMLAQALGGSVEPAPLGGELGWFTIDSDVPDSIPPGPYLQWHSDCIVIPPGAVELARSPVGTQAFRLGSALGLQFHPETPPEVAARWATGGRAQLESLGIDVETLVTRCHDEADAARSRASTIVEAFLRTFSP
ncbi:MAG TPA: type 1 glutamine amidotransferase [Candidatus Limnocylindria bacterium]|nr:type 1 glutamine amidotransferase [Candidatus Limnocylindria bacterium]